MRRWLRPALPRPTDALADSQLVFALLCVEILTFLILIVPMPFTLRVRPVPLPEADNGADELDRDPAQDVQGDRDEPDPRQGAVRAQDCVLLRGAPLRRRVSLVRVPQAERGN